MIDIVIRTKNRPLFLKRALEDVQNQSFTDWKIVLVNDGGDTEQVDQIVEQVDEEIKNKIKVIHNPNSLGMETASNIGLKSSNSKYIVIHDDDDTWEKEFLLKTLNYLEENLTTDGVVTQSCRIDEQVVEDKIRITKKQSFNTWLKRIKLKEICQHNLFPPISFVYRRKVFDSIGYYNEDLKILGDWKFNIRFIEKFKIDLIQEPLANYHFRKSSGKNFSNSLAINKKEIFKQENKVRKIIQKRAREEGNSELYSQMNISALYKIYHWFYRKLN